MEEVREAIGIDKFDMRGNLIFVEEHHHANANFVVHAITSHCMNANKIVCFALFHNTFGHFHNVGMKLGYNLKKELNSNVRIIEPLKMLSTNIHNESMSQTRSDNNNTTSEFCIKKKSNDLVKHLVSVIKDECIAIKKASIDQKLYLIIDDLSHLFDLGLDNKDIWTFIRYLRSLTNIEPDLCICIVSHTYKIVQEICRRNLMTKCLHYLADLAISVQPLETGFSTNVTGKMIIHWKLQEERLKFKLPEEMVYLYKLSDRQVKLFTPGSSCIM